MRARLGKLVASDLLQGVLPHLGAKRGEVRVGPGVGLDCAIVAIGAGQVLALTTDPLSLVPVLGPAESAWMSCHLLASDLWTSGIAPTYASISLTLPPVMSDDLLGTYWRAMGEEWRRLGVAVVTGHTGRYGGCDYSIVGSGTLLGIGSEQGYVTPGMAAPGERIVVTKGFAVELAAIATRLAPEAMSARIGPIDPARALALIERASVVEECRVLVALGVRERGLTAMHDATEGGVLGGLLEVAQACGHDLHVEREKIPFSDEAKAACEVFAVEPWWALSQGALIATLRPEAVARALAALAAAGIPAAEVGEVTPGHGALRVVEGDGRSRVFTQAEPDPYWDAYERIAHRDGSE